MFRASLPLAFALVSCGLGVLVAPSAAALETHSGTLTVTCKIVTDASVPVGTPLNIDVRANVSGAVRYVSVGVIAQVKKSKNSQTVTLTLPYSFTLTDEDNAISVGVQVNPDTDPNPSVSTSLSIPIPNNGATTAVFIPVRV